MTPSAFVSLAIVVSLCSSAHSQVQNWTIWKPSKHSKEMYFFTFLSGNCFCRPFRLWVEGRRLWRCHVLQQRWGMMFKQEEKSRFQHDFFQAPCWLLWLWRRPWLRQPRQWERWVRHDTLLPTFWWGSYYIFLLSILFTCKQMKVTHGETVMSLRLTMVRISAVSTVAMLCR